MGFVDTFLCLIAMLFLFGSGFLTGVILYAIQVAESEYEKNIVASRPNRVLESSST